MLRYKIFAEQARRNGNTKLAALFEKIGGDELDKHFRKQAELLGTVKSDKENLTAAISDEYLEAARMYSEMAKKAEEAGDGKAASISPPPPRTKQSIGKPSEPYLQSPPAQPIELPSPGRGGIS